MLKRLHRRIAALAGGTTLATLAMTSVVGFGTWYDRAAVAGLSVVLVASITGQVRILVQVDDSLELFAGSRVRQVAVSRLGSVEVADIEKLSSTLITSEWRVDGQSYTVGKRADKALETMMSDRRRTP